MPSPLELPEDVRKVDGRWVRECPTCGSEVSHLRRNYCVNASLNEQPCIKCSNANNHPAGMFGPVRIAWYNSFQKSAVSRGYAWEITIEDIATLYELQAGKWAFTGWNVGWSETHWNHSASIDRIDNNKGYTLDNIQIVHKSVNMARGTITVNDFMEMCLAIADKVKW